MERKMRYDIETDKENSLFLQPSNKFWRESCQQNCSNDNQMTFALCEVCGELFSGGNAKQCLKNHQTRYHNLQRDVYVCPSDNCSHSTISSTSMKNHILRTHSTDIPEEHLQKYLEKPANLPKALVENPLMNRIQRQNIKRGCYQKTRHRIKMYNLRETVQEFYCPVGSCKFASKSKRNVRAHLLVHTKCLSAKELERFTSGKGIPWRSINPNTPKAKLEKSEVHQKFVDHKVECISCGQIFKGRYCGTRLKEHDREFHQVFANIFKCPVTHCLYSNVRAQRIRSHIMVKHAQHLTPQELQNHLQPESIFQQYDLNPRYKEPAMPKTVKLDPIIKIKSSDVPSKFKCDICQQGFNLIGNLKRHEKEFHSETSKWYKCPVSNCDYKAKRLDRLRKHIRTHAKNGHFTQKQMEVYLQVENIEIIPSLKQPKQEACS